jgi:hypothetical protein
LLVALVALAVLWLELTALRAENQALKTERADTQRQLSQLESSLQRLNAERAALRAPAPVAPAASSAAANPAGEAGASKLQAGRRAQVDRDLAALTARLALSAAQVRDISQLLRAESDQAARQAARLLQGHMPTQDLKKWDAGHTAVQAQIRSVLTDDQRAQFDAYRAAENNRAADKKPLDAAVPAQSPVTSGLSQQQLAGILASLKQAAASAPAAADRPEPTRP